MTRRVAVTGIGCISGAGNDVPTFWRQVVAGASAIRQVERTVLGETLRFPAADIRGYDPLSHFQTSELLLRDP
jgi:3-oxoacyl-(acyl-carrier-protein) synthase